jgi:transcriptional regulator with GAF, ATPase, and Fis domain
MERFASLLVEAWREVGRHEGLQETLAALVPRLAPDLPVATLWIRAADPARRALDTVAAVGAHAAALHDELAVEAWERLLAWSREGEILCDTAVRLRQQLGDVVPEELAGRFVVGPLASSGALLGIALFGLARGARPEPVHLRRAQALLEPLGAALANELRLHELRALREAAEADRRALLGRLGRRDIGDVVVGTEAGLAGVMERVALVADSDVPVLILGETGSGKEVIARSIRARSRRAAGPFVRVNCGAIPPGLIDSELFGHERGSFTGATARRRGWFERADAGTLFLDEVGELPLEAQVRLLRVLQDGSVERVGGDQPVHVDVRVIAATHRDLPARVADGRFREDLWYRLAVFPIHLPPLRERLDDLPALATHFALRACERFGSRALAPTPADLERLAAYPWPGNVRELQSVIDRAVILGGGERLEVAAALGGAVPPPRAGAAPAPAASEPGDAGRGDRFPSLDEAMARHIEAALARSGGRIEGPDGAAQRLRINPHTLRARMRKLGVDPRRFRRAARRR